MPRAGRKPCRDLREAPCLRLRERRVGVRRGEVRHEARQVQRGEVAAGERPARLVPIGGRHAPAPHAGVDLDVYPAGRAARMQPGQVVGRGDADLEARCPALLPGIER